GDVEPSRKSGLLQQGPRLVRVVGQELGRLGIEPHLPDTKRPGAHFAEPLKHISDNRLAVDRQVDSLANSPVFEWRVGLRVEREEDLPDALGLNDGQLLVLPDLLHVLDRQVLDDLNAARDQLGQTRRALRDWPDQKPRRALLPAPVTLERRQDDPLTLVPAIELVRSRTNRLLAERLRAARLIVGLWDDVELR